jgi:uracil-DNA glycosylase
VADLAAARIGTAVNPYAPADERPELDRPGAAGIRAENLRRYLQARIRVPLLLVGEAAGYRGCRFSGIAFTSERSLPRDRWSSRNPRGWQEPSATIVHGALRELGLEEQALLWNAVPLHAAGPHPLSNRMPTAGELLEGVRWLERLIALIRPGHLLAIGRTAGRALPDVPVLRHPANAGATLFRAGLAAEVRRLGLTD